MNAVRVESGALRVGDLVPDHALTAEEPDRFGHAEIAERVADLVTTADTPLNVALFGSWGSGKSSFATLLKSALRKRQTKTAFGHYDAWKYQGEALQRSFIADAATQLLGEDHEDYARFTSQLAQSVEEMQISLKGVSRKQRKAHFAWIWGLVVPPAALLVLAFIGAVALVSYAAGRNVGAELLRHAWVVGGAVLLAVYPVNAVFNPAAAACNGATVLLARVEDRRGISHLTVARSANGTDGWAIEPEPLLAPADGIPSEQRGFEDARVVWIEELGHWAITCTVYGPAGPGVFLATTEDFSTTERYGVIRHPEDKNAALLPHRIDGRWVLLHRPKTEYGGGHGEIVLSRSDDLVSWSAPEAVLQPRDGAWWDSSRIGIGPPPLRTEHGWLLIYHGVKETMAGDIYRSASPCSTSTSRPASSVAFPRGFSPRWRTTSEPATFPTPSSLAACSTVRPATRSASTTARPTARSASPPHA